MFQINDKIVYPMHGAGIVKDIKTMDLFDDEEKEYYDLEIISEKMNIYIPVDTAEEIGVRPIVSPEVIDEMLESLHGAMDEMNRNWSKRYQNNMEILKTGDLFEVANVVKNLTLLNRNKGLSTGEKKMMTSARNYLISEIVLVKNVDNDEALRMINSAIG